MKAVGSLAIAILALACAAPACAQNFPSRPLRIVTPFAPGATTDLLSRILCAKMTETWGQPCLTDNRPGATGVIGADIAAKAPNDGHTLVNVISSHVVHSAIYKKVPFHPLND